VPINHGGQEDIYCSAGNGPQTVRLVQLVDEVLAFGQYIGFLACVGYKDCIFNFTKRFSVRREEPHYSTMNPPDETPRFDYSSSSNSKRHRTTPTNIHIDSLIPRCAHSPTARHPPPQSASEDDNNEWES
jgi:hypothetical protein